MRGESNKTQINGATEETTAKPKNDQTASKAMNDTSTLSADMSFRPRPHLLDAIRTIRASVGDGLNDNELTRLLRASALQRLVSLRLTRLANQVELYSVLGGWDVDKSSHATALISSSGAKR